jgi:hypothetical protein
VWPEAAPRFKTVVHQVTKDDDVIVLCDWGVDDVFMDVIIVVVLVLCVLAFEKKEARCC